MATEIAICRDALGTYTPVFCKVWENSHGVTCLTRTRQQITEEHPDLQFVAWVADLSDTESLKLYFLSPNVMWRVIWVETQEGFKQVRLNRDLSIQPIN